MEFVVMGLLKLGAVLGTGIGISAAFAQFHSYEWKPKKKKEKGEGNDNGKVDAKKVGQVLRQKAGSTD